MRSCQTTKQPHVYQDICISMSECICAHLSTCTVNCELRKFRFLALIFTCSRLQRCTERAVADTVRRFDREIVNVTTFQAFDGAEGGCAVAVEYLSIRRIGTAKILHSSFTGSPRQDGRVCLTIHIHCKTRGLTGHCEDRERRPPVSDSNRKLDHSFLHF